MPPVVIAHRGASGYRPEHTLRAYRLAIELGADFIEPDLVPTADGVLVARHSNEISGSTDVAGRPEFAARVTTKTVDGSERSGWFTEDFTLAELRQLRAVEPTPAQRPGNTAYDGVDPIPTLEEVVDLAREAGVGVYPETKHPAYFAGLGLRLDEPLLQALAAVGWTGHDDPVFIQSFDPAHLRELRGRTGARLVQLLAAQRRHTGREAPAPLAAIAAYADAIGPSKELIVRAGTATALVDDAHGAGLLVHPWTLGAEAAEYALFYRLGVDGVLSDYPDVAVGAR